MAPTATFLNCTLKPGPAASSTDAMLDLFAGELAAQGGEEAARIRVVDHDVKAGVSHDEGDGDQWPTIKAQIEANDLLVVGTPIWLGHPGSVVQRVLERLDAYIAETDERGQMPPADKVALVAVVGNEDGAHLVGSQLYQGLADIGFTIPANGMAYWVGEAMGGTDFNDLDEVPEKVRSQVKMTVANGLHLAGLLAADGYPQVG